MANRDLALRDQLTGAQAFTTALRITAAAERSGTAVVKDEVAAEKEWIESNARLKHAYTVS
jgi:hypothetical protein